MARVRRDWRSCSERRIGKSEFGKGATIPDVSALLCIFFKEGTDDDEARRDLRELREFQGEGDVIHDQQGRTDTRRMESNVLSDGGRPSLCLWWISCLQRRGRCRQSDKRRVTWIRSRWRSRRRVHRPGYGGDQAGSDLNTHAHIVRWMRTPQVKIDVINHL